MNYINETLDRCHYIYLLLNAIIQVIFSTNYCDLSNEFKCVKVQLFDKGLNE